MDRHFRLSTCSMLKSDKSLTNVGYLQLILQLISKIWKFSCKSKLKFYPILLINYYLLNSICTLLHVINRCFHWQIELAKLFGKQLIDYKSKTITQKTSFFKISFFILTTLFESANYQTLVDSNSQTFKTPQTSNLPKISKKTSSTKLMGQLIFIL